MATVLEISNQALLLVGDREVTAVTDDNPRAKAVNQSWPFVRREVLRSHSWNFATFRVQLVPNLGVPLYDFTNAFDLPIDYLRIFELSTGGDWRVENAFIVTNASGEVFCRYLKDVTNTTLWDSIFIEAMVLRLAVEIVDRVTDSRVKKETLYAQYEEKLAEARSADGEEQSPAFFEEDPWLLARYS